MINLDLSKFYGGKMVYFGNYFFRKFQKRQYYLQEGDVRTLSITELGMLSQDILWIILINSSWLDRFVKHNYCNKHSQISGRPKTANALNLTKPRRAGR